MLRNTRFVYGAVIYTGHQSKVMMNATAVPSKRSSLERRLDLLIVIMFSILAVICVVGAIGSVLSLDEVRGSGGTAVRWRPGQGNSKGFVICSNVVKIMSAASYSPASGFRALKLELRF